MEPTLFQNSAIQNVIIAVIALFVFIVTNDSFSEFTCESIDKLISTLLHKKAHKAWKEGHGITDVKTMRRLVESWYMKMNEALRETKQCVHIDFSNTPLTSPKNGRHENSEYVGNILYHKLTELQFDKTSKIRSIFCTSINEKIFASLSADSRGALDVAIQEIYAAYTMLISLYDTYDGPLHVTGISRQRESALYEEMLPYVREIEDLLNSAFEKAQMVLDGSVTEKLASIQKSKSTFVAPKTFVKSKAASYELPVVLEIRSKSVQDAAKTLTRKMDQYNMLLGDDDSLLQQFKNLYFPTLTILLEDLLAAEKVHLDVAGREQSCLKAFSIVLEALDNRIEDADDMAQMRMAAEVTAMERTAKIKGDLEDENNLLTVPTKQ